MERGDGERRGGGGICRGWQIDNRRSQRPISRRGMGVTELAFPKASGFVRVRGEGRGVGMWRGWCIAERAISMRRGTWGLGVSGDRPRLHGD